MRSVYVLEHIKINKHNPNYLSSAELHPAQLDLSNDINKIVKEYDVLIFAIPSAFLTLELEKLTENLADKIIFQSRYISSYLKYFLINRFTSKTVIYNGVNIDYFKPNNNDKKNEIICVEGSINSNYAVEILNSIKLYKITLVGNIEKSFKSKIVNNNISYIGVIDRKKIPEIIVNIVLFFIYY